MEKVRARYEKPEMRRVELTPSEAVLTACKTTKCQLINAFCGDRCLQWIANCKQGGS